MQVDEDIGKISASAPILMCKYIYSLSARATELFLTELVNLVCNSVSQKKPVRIEIDDMYSPHIHNIVLIVVAPHSV